MIKKLPTQYQITKDRCFKTVLLTVVLLFANAEFVKAQVGNYVVDQLQITPAYTNLPAGKTVVHGGTWNDAVSTAISTGFTTPFKFNGADQPSFYISSNGFITFGAAPATTNYSPIANASTAYTGAIAVYAANLSVATTASGTPQPNSVSYFLDTSGGTGNYIMKIEYRSFLRIATETIVWNMQLWLYEGSNVIEMFYETPAANFAATTSGQIGLRGINNLAPNFKALQLGIAPWPALPAVMTENTTFAGTVVQTRSGSTNKIFSTSNRLFRWTPVDCVAPSLLVASNPTSNSFDISFTASPSSPPSYDYYLSTTSTPPLDTDTPTGTIASGDTVGSLLGGTQYYIWIRSNCTVGDSSWNGTTISTLCNAQPAPYVQAFNPAAPGYTYTVPAIPPCSSIQQVGTGSVWKTANANVANGFPTEHLQYFGVAANANVWFYTNGVSLENGKSYRISYKYGGSTDFTFLTNRMNVQYGTAPTATAMAAGIAIADHPSIKASPLTNVVNFVTPAGPPGNTVYYFGFRAYSLGNNGTLFLDDIDIQETTCFAPTGLVSGQVTTNSALISWTAPAVTPSAGYDYYISTSPAVPSSSATPIVGVGPTTTLQNLSGLTPNTTYYVWVRSNCGNGDISGWSLANTSFTTFATVNYTGCNPLGTGAQDPNGITNVTFGTINNSTGLEAGNYGDYSNLSTSVAQGTTVPVNITYQVGPYDYSTRIWVDWNNNNSFLDAGELVVSGLSQPVNPTTLVLNLAIPLGAPLGPHRLRIGGADFDTTPGPCRSGTFQAFEDYTIFVTAAPPQIVLSASSATTCVGIPTNPVLTIVSGASNYNVFQWSPSASVTGTVGTGWTFNPTNNTIYTLTAFNTTTLKSTTATFIVEVKLPPTAITITQAAGNVCAGSPRQLTATGGIVFGDIFSEGFNGGLPSTWTTTNTSSPAASAPLAAWTVQPDGHNTGNIWSTTLRSNDNSSFIISNSDAQGIGTQTKVSLTSPAIDLLGFTSANLSFWHYYRHLGGETTNVQVSINGTTWTTVRTYTATQGTPTGFVNEIIDLAAFVNNATVYVRWNYDATWDWGWAIDNVSVSGNSPSQIQWTPIAGLYTSSTAAPGTEYVAGSGAATVYAMPTADTTYTATATTGLGCTQTSTVAVTVTQIAGGTVAPTNQFVCGSAASPVVLSGQVGTILFWETATNPAFTGATVVSGSAGASTLTSVMIGIVTVQRYFRAVIQVTGCSSYAYSISHIIYADVATWNGSVWVGGITPTTTRGAVFNGAYTSVVNSVLDACSVVVNSGAVLFSSGSTLNVKNKVTVVGGSLTFNNNASLVQDSPVANAGNITYKRLTTPMHKFDYTYWGTPVSPQTMLNLSPGTLSDKFFYFDTTTYQWTYTPTLATTAMQPGLGYIIRSPDTFPLTGLGTQFAANFVGVPNNGDYSVPAVKTSAIRDRNAMSNPYPSAISANLFMTNSSNSAAFSTGTTIYFWTHNTPITASAYAPNDFATYNFSGGTMSAPTTPCAGCNTTAPDGTIAAGQGFLISVVNTGNFTATFKNSMRLVGQNGKFYRNSGIANDIDELEKNRVWLDLTNMDGAFKQILVGYIENATNDYDNGFDGEIIEAGNSVSFYSLVNTSKLTIQGRSLPFNESDTVPLGYRSATAGTYTVSLSDKDGLFADGAVSVYLEDTLLNVVHNLSDSPYVFATESGTFDTRFILRYSSSTLAVSSPAFTENSVVAYKSAGSAFVETANFEMKSVKIYDVRGRLITAMDNINNNKVEIPLNIAPQVLLITITSRDNIIVTKKILF